MVLSIAYRAWHQEHLQSESLLPNSGYRLHTCSEVRQTLVSGHDCLWASLATRALVRAKRLSNQKDFWLAGEMRKRNKARSLRKRVVGENAGIFLCFSVFRGCPWPRVKVVSVEWCSYESCYRFLNCWRLPKPSKAFLSFELARLLEVDNTLEQLLEDGGSEES